MVDVKELANRAHELHKKGLKPFEIGDELHLSVDTVNYLLEEGSEGLLPPSDVKIGWRSIGVSPRRLSLVAQILADIASEEMARLNQKAEGVAGIAINGISLALSMSQSLGTELLVYRPPAERASSGGAFSSNYASPVGKHIIVVDDVLSTGHAMECAIEDIKQAGGIPLLCVVMVNKSSLNEIKGVPLRGMLRARSIGGTILGGGPLRSFAYK
ncbi:MAG: orotate phosphoribosyltransferase-like protein [Methanomassiliicoccales archaeon]